MAFIGYGRSRSGHHLQEAEGPNRQRCPGLPRQSFGNSAQGQEPETHCQAYPVQQKNEPCPEGNHHARVLLRLADRRTRRRREASRLQLLFRPLLHCRRRWLETARNLATKRKRHKPRFPAILALSSCSSLQVLAAACLVLEFAPTKARYVVRSRLNYGGFERVVIVKGGLGAFVESTADDAPVKSHGTTGLRYRSVWRVYDRRKRRARGRDARVSSVDNLHLIRDPAESTFAATASGRSIGARVPRNAPAAQVNSAEAAGVHHHISGIKALTGKVQHHWPRVHNDLPVFGEIQAVEVVRPGGHVNDVRVADCYISIVPRSERINVDRCFTAIVIDTGRTVVRAPRNTTARRGTEGLGGSRGKGARVTRETGATPGKRGIDLCWEQTCALIGTATCDPVRASSLRHVIGVVDRPIDDRAGGKSDVPVRGQVSSAGYYVSPAIRPSGRIIAVGAVAATKVDRFAGR